jgi:hypothetical protein
VGAEDEQAANSLWITAIPLERFVVYFVGSVIILYGSLKIVIGTNAPYAISEGGTMGIDEVRVRCGKCGSQAVWYYMPNGEGDSPYFCDEHVSRGCSCNVDPETGVEDLDEQGRKFPCCEYTYSEEGFVEEVGDEVITPPGLWRDRQGILRYPTKLGWIPAADKIRELLVISLYSPNPLLQFYKDKPDEPKG